MIAGTLLIACGLALLAVALWIGVRPWLGRDPSKKRRT